jgi:transcriptional regulator with XRE-family HTH domain
MGELVDVVHGKKEVIAMTGTDLRRRLDLAGIGQADVARRAGVSGATICRALRGQRTLRPEVTRAAEALIRERVARAAQALLPTP